MSLFHRREPLSENGLFKGMCDYHSHILPGVDDGLRTMEKSMDVLRRYEESGVSEVWFTPHIMEEIPNESMALRERFEEFKSHYEGPVVLRLSAEYMLDSLFDARLSGGDLLPIGERGDTLLVETSYFTPPMDLVGKLKSILRSGYYPLLAHPERYEYMSMEEYERLHDEGILFQLNIGSVCGLYGDVVRRKSQALLSRGYYHLFGSDVHSRGYLSRILEGSVDKKRLAQIESLKENRI